MKMHPVEAAWRRQDRFWKRVEWVSAAVPFVALAWFTSAEMALLVAIATMLLYLCLRSEQAGNNR